MSKLETPNVARSHTRRRLLNSLIFAALTMCGCVPSRSSVTAASLHPSLSATTLTRDRAATYGYRGTEGTAKQRHEYDLALHLALQRALPPAWLVGPTKLKRWLEQTNQADMLGAALDEHAEALPYDQLAPLGEQSRYLIWARVLQADQDQWMDEDGDSVDYCVAWRLQVYYAIADLRFRQLVAEATIDDHHQDCNRNPRSNSYQEAPTLGGMIASAFIDVLVDAATDAALGTYPEVPPMEAQLEKNAAQFFRVIPP